MIFFAISSKIKILNRKDVFSGKEPHKGSPMSDRNKNPYLVTSTDLNCLIIHQCEYDLGIDSGNYNL